MEAKTIDINLLRHLYPNPRPAEPPQTCGYCVGGALMAFIDGITAARADQGHTSNGTKNYFPLSPELAEALHKANPQLPMAMAERYAEFITRLNDAKKFHFAWSYLKDAVEFKEPETTSLLLHPIRAPTPDAATVDEGKAKIPA